MTFRRTNIAICMTLTALLLMAACSKNVKKESSQAAYQRLKPEFEGDMIVIERGLSIEDYLQRHQEKSMAGGEDGIVTESLWNETSGNSFLFVDHKARNIGDVITILIVESSSASKSASTSTSRNSSSEGAINSLLGLPSNLGMKNFMGLGQPFSPNFKGSHGSSFSGSGRTSRSDKITATVTAVVIDVLPNGNLKILGRREIKVNEENQIITISGIIRQADIDDNNAIKSTAIAEAQIKYFGDGIIARKQQEGWLTRFLEKIWPF